MSLRRLALASLLLPWALTGCSGPEPTPQLPDPTTTSATSSQTPSAAPVEPTPPPEIQGDDEAAAEAFVKYYFAMLNYVQSTGDVEPAEKLAMSGCKACSGALEVVRDAYGGGGTIEGGHFTVKGVSALAQGRLPKGVRPFSARATVHTSRQVVRGSEDPTMNGVYKQTATRMHFALVHSRRGWQIAEWSVL